MIYAAFAMALLANQTPQAATDTVIATYKIAGREVVAKLPAAKALLPSCSSYTSGPWSYLFDPKGKFLGRIADGWRMERGRLTLWPC